MLLILVACFCFWQSSRQGDGLLRLRAAYKLDAGQPLENAPPMLVFTTVALGGFSGLLADMLWLRVSFLQDEDRYFELVQLSDWISKLEPRCPEVWAFHAWNMSYNISVMMGDMDDRWRWVMSGVSLLRDDGLRFNPGDGKLCGELAWIYQFKIGGNTDGAHKIYKKKLADEIGLVLKDGRFDYDAVMGDPSTARRLRGELKLQPAIMREVDLKYGPLDWRVPEAHAVYWAYIGRQKAKGQDRTDCERIIYQSMAGNFLRGRLVFKPSVNIYLSTPNVDLLPSAMKTYESAIERLQDPGMKVAYRYFLNEAIAVLVRLRQTDKAKETFKVLRDRYPKETGADFELHLKTADYVDLLGRIYTEFEDPAEAAGEKPASENWVVMGTQMSVSVAGNDRNRLMEYVRECKAVSKKLEELFSVFRADSEVTFINQSAGWSPVNISQQTEEVLLHSLRYSELSGGTFDITVAPLVRFWGFNRGPVPEKLPDSAEVEKVRKLVGYSNLSVSNGSAFLMMSDMSIDLGGIAKGYAVDVCYKRLVDLGGSSFMVDLGGNLRCAGDAGGRPWRVGIRNPFDKADIIGTLALTNGMATGTSGNYEKYIMIGNERFTHIINPRTGYPVKGMAGVTIVSTNAVDTEGMSKPLFIVGVQGASSLLAKVPGCEAILIPDKQPVEIFVSPGMRAIFQPDPAFSDKVKPIE
ncbi:MAG: hypothetical protein C0404_00010 [Verrucomicrobia bacterium]|nr:hypothetical protein [Verrucomicrobiota bacterium]